MTDALMGLGRGLEKAEGPVFLLEALPEKEAWAECSMSDYFLPHLPTKGKERSQEEKVKSFLMG